MADGNTGTNEETKVTGLMKLLARRKAEGGKEPADKEKAKLFAEFKKLLADRQKAEKAAQAAIVAFNKHAETMVMAFGDKKVKVDGVLYFPASREDTVFYRSIGAPKEEDIVEG